MSDEPLTPSGTADQPCESSPPAILDEASARTWLQNALHVSRETMAALDDYVALLVDGAGTQNLLAASTLPPDALWPRHIVDSAQLLLHAPAPASGADTWVDLGSGPGLPGLVVALLQPQWRVTLVESRRLRCDFLNHAITTLGLQARVRVAHASVESLPACPHRVISARAFAPLGRLLDTARHLAGDETIWVLPKGRNAVNELSSLREAWQSRFRVERSVTDKDADILIGQGAFRS